MFCMEITKHLCPSNVNEFKTKIRTVTIKQHTVQQQMTHSTCSIPVNSTPIDSGLHISQWPTVDNIDTSE